MGINLQTMPRDETAVKACFEPKLDAFLQAIERWQQATGVARHGARLRLFSDAPDAVAGADAVYTDTWTSMGQESEQAARRRAVVRSLGTRALARDDLAQALTFATRGASVPPLDDEGAAGAFSASSRRPKLTMRASSRSHG